MKLIQINKGNKCPNCKKFGLEPRHYVLSIVYEPKVTDLTGHLPKELNNHKNFYRCKNCYAEYKEL